ncbi:glucuronate isomerase [Cryobacterium zongtaii]|uniref:glucuronate isomerase n=1 Tax=Cryobacterium zongtaii TaxID=1259217 RepID=UPI002434C347|nr:glucuronate isomerase [Cryobacterium zongtaii]
MPLRRLVSQGETLPRLGVGSLDGSQPAESDPRQILRRFMAGVYPAMRVGTPWWFLDSPEGMRRFRESATESAGFSNMSGCVDDTRAFWSIPARHDLARRMDAGYLARLVAGHRLDLDEAVDTAADLAYRLPLAA